MKYTNIKITCEDCHLNKMNRCPYTTKSVCGDGKFSTYFASLANLPRGRDSENLKFSNLPKDLKILYKYIDELVDNGFYGVIYGNKEGLGLTSYVIKLVNHYLTKIKVQLDAEPIYAAYILTADYLDNYRLFMNGNLNNDLLKTIIENIKTIPLLVLDSFGLTYYNDYDLQVLGKVLDARRSSKNATVIVFSSYYHPQNIDLDKKLLMGAKSIYAEEPLFGGEK